MHGLPLPKEVIGLRVLYDFETEAWRVNGLWSESPAVKAGIREGDIVLAINGKPLPRMDPNYGLTEIECSREAMSQFSSKIKPLKEALRDSQLLEVKIQRGGKELLLRAQRTSMSELYKRGNSAGTVGGHHGGCFDCIVFPPYIGCMSVEFGYAWCETSDWKCGQCYAGGWCDSW